MVMLEEERDPVRLANARKMGAFQRQKEETRGVLARVQDALQKTKRQKKPELSEVEGLLDRADEGAIKVLEYVDRQLSELHTVVSRIPDWVVITKKVGEYQIIVGPIGCGVFTDGTLPGYVSPPNSMMCSGAVTLVSRRGSLPPGFQMETGLKYRKGDGLKAAQHLEEILSATESVIIEAKEQIAKQVPFWQGMIEKFAPISVLEVLREK